MSRLASILYLAGCITAANAASSVPVATQPILSTSTVSTVSNVLSTSLSIVLSTSTMVLHRTSTFRGSVTTISTGEQLSIITSTDAIVSSSLITELITVINTVDSKTLYSVISNTSPTLSSPSSSLPASTSTILPPVVVTSSSQTIATTPVNVLTSTTSISNYSTSIATTSPAAATTSLSTSTAVPEGASKKKLSGGAAACIALGAAIATGSIAGALVIVFGKRRRQEKGDQTAIDDRIKSESKSNLFSPDARAGYDNMLERPIVVSEKEIWPGTATTTSNRVSAISHERADSSTLGIDAPSIAHSGTPSPEAATFGDKAASKPVPNFSTPSRRVGSITALPKCESRG